MFVSIQTVRKGDTIRETYLDGKGRLQVEKGPGSKVSNIEHRACSSLGTHINKRECFDSTALVWRERGELQVVDWDIDNNIPASDPRSPFNPEIQEPDEITVGEYLESARAFTWVKPELASI